MGQEGNAMRQILAIGLVITAVPVATPRAQPPAAEGANAILPWAYVLNEPTSGNADVPDPEEVLDVALAERKDRVPRRKNFLV